MKRYAVLAVLAAGLLVTGAVVLLLARSPDPNVSRDRYARVAPGMTEAEVQDLLGESLQGYPYDVLSTTLQGQLDRSHHAVTWFSRDGAIVIGFDEHGRVIEKSRNRTQYPTVLDHVEGLVTGTGAGTAWIQEAQHSAADGVWAAASHLTNRNSQP